MVNSVDELRAAAARLKKESDNVARLIESLPPHALECNEGKPARTEEEILRIIDEAISLFEKREKRPVHVTGKVAATMLGVSPRTISNMLKTGELRYNRCGRIPIEQIDMAGARSKK